MMARVRPIYMLDALWNSEAETGNLRVSITESTPFTHLSPKTSYGVEIIDNYVQGMPIRHQVIA